MKFKQLALASSVCAVLAGGTGVANAAIPGIPGEALLVPMVLSAANDRINLETYVGLYVPTTIGTDQIINVYSAPHTTTAGTVTTQTVVPYRSGATAPEIYWTLYDENSKKLTDGRCEVSPGDLVLWTTDLNIRALQQNQTSQILQAGIQGVPSSVCGPTTRNRFGYVVFQTMEGADGQDAGFAFAADAAVVEGTIGSTFGVPVMPMADGKDSVAQTTPLLYNEVIAGTQWGTKQPASPVAVAPILSGIRMNDADGQQEDVVIQAPIQGPLGGSGMSLHVFWFDRNDKDRVADLVIWDDQEGFCSQTYPLPRELNLVLWNHFVSVRDFPSRANWTNLNGEFNVDQSVTDVISAVKPDPITGYTSAEYCAPDYWTERFIAGPLRYDGALSGYVEYTLDEIGEPASPGWVNSAAVAFHLQQVNGNLRAPAIASQCSNGGCGIFGQLGWTSHMSLDRGKH
jgi:hypothetical protein